MKKLFLLLLIAPFLWVSCPSSDSGTPTTGGGGGAAISLNQTSLVLIYGKTAKLTVTVSGTNKAVTWSTSNANIATVNAGEVKAIAPGQATITVTSKADASKTAQCAVTVNPRPVFNIGAKDGLSNKTAAQYFADNNIYIGWNLGNAFDGTNYGAWTRKIDRDFLPKVKAAGFNMVRIPVTWDRPNHRVGAAPNYTIDATYLNSLAEVVDWAYEAGLVTIINIHHDGSQNGTTFNSSTEWLSMLRLKQSSTERATATAKFVKIWEQVAKKFQNYGDWLIFEPFNELHNGEWGWGNISPTEYEIINDLNQKFTTTVRNAGGKNAQRFLVVQPYCAKPHQALASTFTIPKDTVTGKQIISMHYYEPENFCLNGDNNAVNWGSASDKSKLTGQFEEYADKFTKNNIPVILGECGATYQKRTDTALSATAAANRLVYMDYMCSEAKRNKLIPVYWDNGTVSASSVGENFGLWNRQGGGDLNVFTNPNMQPVIDAMVNAVY